MELHGVNGQAIAMGNARMAQVKDLNDRIQQHNSDVSNQISSLKEQTKSADELVELKNTATGLWTAKDMPSKVKAYSDWRASSNATNPTTNVERSLTSNAETKNPMRTAFSGADNLPTPEVSTISTATETAERVSGTANGGEALGKTGTQVMDGLKTAVDTEGSSVLGKIGESAGIMGSAAIGGLDIYSDIKAGGIAGNNNWEKAGNLLQIGGSVADIVGTAFPPAALIGGVLDLASAATDEIGQQLDEGASSAALKAKQASETLQTVAAPLAQSTAVGTVS